jgi:hypothetical protein
MMPLIRAVSASPARCGWCYADGAQWPEIDVRAAVALSKPVTVIHYSCITDAIRGFR